MNEKERLSRAMRRMEAWRSNNRAGEKERKGAIRSE